MKLGIIDLEFIFRPDHEGGPLLSGQSKSLNVSCHVRLREDDLRSLGFTYLKTLCKRIKRSMLKHLETKLIEGN